MKTALQIGLSALLAAALAFYGGVTYGRAGGGAAASGRGFAAQGPAGQGANANAVRFRGGFANGEVISADGESITVKSEDGSTKTVYFDSGTRVLRSEEATLTDVAKGATVVIAGTSGDDGSVTARSIQIVPKGSNLGVFGGVRGGMPGGPAGTNGSGTQGGTGRGGAGGGQDAQGGFDGPPPGDVMMAPPQ